MTETEKKHTVPEPIPVDAKKLIDALGTIFGGVVQLLKATEPGIAKCPLPGKIDTKKHTKVE